MSDQLRGGTTIGGFLATHQGNFNSTLKDFTSLTLTGNVTATGNFDINGDLSLTTTIPNGTITFAKIQDIDTASFLGRVTTGTGDVENLTVTQVRSMLNVASGAEVNVQSDWNETTDTNDDYIKNKPNVQYTSAIAADVFTSTEVTNLRAAKLDDGTTPWTAKLPLTGGDITGGLIVSGSGTSGGTAYGEYRTGADNIILKGNALGVSGIFFQSEKDGVNINHPSDFGFIQYHAYGIDGTSGESNRLVIGVANDSTDKVVLQSPYKNGAVVTYQDAGSGTAHIEYAIWHEGNVANAVGADELNVSGNGTTSQYLRSDGDGTFTWVTPPNDNTTYSDGNGITQSGTVFSLGTPSTLTGSTSNGVTSSSHTHDITTTATAAASTIVQTDSDGYITATTRFKFGSEAYIEYNADSESIDFVFA